MKKIILIAILISFTNFTNADKTVYVCGKSKIYHTSKSHTALKKRCKSKITEHKESEAIKLKKRKCKCKS